MKAIIDEGVPRRLATSLRQLGREVLSFPGQWRGLSNGALLAELERMGFGCLLTCDRNLYFQQEIANRQIGILVLPAQRFEDLEPYLPAIVEELDGLEAGEVVYVERRPLQP